MKIKRNFKVIKKRLNNGLKVIIIKNHCLDKIAAIITPHGNDTSLGSINGKKVLNGTAHFLEHRIFDTINGDATDLFDNLGLSCNAETSYDYTSYYFFGSDNFLDGLKILLSMVSSLTFDEESVEKERPIILEELNEDLNDSGSLLFSQTLSNLFSSSPFKDRILGDKKDIKAISKEDLYSFFETFYSPKEMILLLIGDIPSDIVSDLNALDLPSRSAKNEFKMPEIIELEEPLRLKSTIKDKSPIPYWCIGYKFNKEIRERFAKTQYSFSVLLDLISDILFSEASDFKDFLKNSDFDKEMRISFESSALHDTYFLFIRGINEEYSKMESLIRDYLQFIYDNIDEEYLSIMQKNYFGKWIVNMSSPDELYNSYLSFRELDDKFYEGYEAVFDYSLDDIRRFLKVLIDANSTFVVVK